MHMGSCVYRLIGVLILVACNGAETSTVDASVDVAVVPEGGCPRSIAEYCSDINCPSQALDLATCEGEHTVGDTIDAAVSGSSATTDST
jgi:hypothetical protein